MDGSSKRSYDTDSTGRLRPSSPNGEELAKGAMIVDEAKHELVEALQQLFNAHMNAKIASVGVDTNYFVEANITLQEAKEYLKANFKDVLNI